MKLRHIISDKSIGNPPIKEVKYKTISATYIEPNLINKFLN